MSERQFAGYKSTVVTKREKMIKTYPGNIFNLVGVSVCVRMRVRERDGEKVLCAFAWSQNIRYNKQMFAAFVVGMCNINN